MSCFCVIATVIVASVALPAFAVLSVIKPSKLIPTIVNNGDGIYSYTYRLPTAPLWKVFADGQLIHQQQQEFSIYTSDYGASGDPLFRIRLYSTGAEPSTSKADCPVLDLTDFKTNSVLSFGFNVQIRLECTTGGSSNLTWSSLSAPEIYWYDVDYNYIGKWTGTNTSIDLDATTPISFWALQNSYSIAIPSNAVFCVPAATIRLYDPGQGSITNISTTHAEYFDFTVTKDSVIENSDTMKAIENQLDDLNDKADTIINGTPEDKAEAEAIQNQIDKYHQDMDDTLSDLDEYEHWDNESVMDDIQSFIKTDGWKQVRELLSPLLDWSPLATIMLLALSMINLSIILFGR